MEMLLWSVLLLVVGLGLIFLEIFVPSGGAIACLSALAVMGAIIVAFLGGLKYGIAKLAVTSVLVPSAVVAALRWWPHTPIGRLMLIPRPKSPDDVLPESEQYRGLRQLIGKRGIARSCMLLSGVVRIDDRVYDAVSEGMPIDPGQRVKVVDVRTCRIVVRPVSDEEPGVQEPATEDLLSRPIDSLGSDGPLV